MKASSKSSLQFLRTLQALRAIVFYVLMALSVIVFTPLSLLPLPYCYRYNWFIRGWCRFNLWTLKTICGVSYRIEGLENIPNHGGVILACKHQSAWETFALIAILPIPVSFVYKRELIYLPLFGQVLFTLKMIPIDRQQGSKAFSAVCKKSKQYLSKGHVVLMFPEGTRTAIDNKNPTYRSGVARLALATKTPVIPVSLNSGFFWRRNAFIKTPGQINVIVHPAVSSTQMNTLTAPQLTDIIKNTIEKAIEYHQ